MRNKPSPQILPTVLKRERPPPAVSGEPDFTPRGSAERPPSLRESIVRWLNQPL